MSDITITAERQNVVDFTHPFMNFGVSILYKKSEYLPFHDIEDLYRLDGKIPYGALKGGSTMAFFKDSPYPIYQNMYKWMTENPHHLVRSSQEAVEKVDRGYYAYFMESATIDYVTERHCNLQKVGKLLNSKSYGIALQKSEKLKMKQRILNKLFNLNFRFSLSS